MATEGLRNEAPRAAIANRVLECTIISRPSCCHPSAFLCLGTPSETRTCKKPGLKETAYAAAWTTTRGYCPSTSFVLAAPGGDTVHNSSLALATTSTRWFTALPTFNSERAT